MEKIDIPYRFINAQRLKRAVFDPNIPDMETMEKLEKGDKVKISNGKEQFLVSVEKIDYNGIEGKIENLLLENKNYDKGDKIRFRKDNVLQIAPKLRFKDIIGKFSDTETIDIKKYPNITSYFPYTKTPEKLLLNKEAIYSISYPKIMREIIELIETQLNTSLQNMVITDATANVGGSVINFAKKAKFVNAVEISPATFNLLANNVAVYNLKNVKLYNDDYLKIMHNLTQDIIFIDPPWGGLDYKEKKNMMLYLGDMPVWQIVLNLKNKAKLIVLKLPLNFDTDEFEEKITDQEIIYHRLEKLLLLFVQTTDSFKD